jgi:preprotein translocase subunit SecB
MTQEVQFPIRLSDAFFTSLQIRRMPNIPEPMEIAITLGVRVHSEQFPDSLQIDLKVETAPDQPLLLSLELVALFELIEGHTRPDRSIIPEFMNQRALYMLWPYIAQIIKQVTALMGMNPVSLRTPEVFHFALPEEVVEATPSEETSG